MVDVSDGTAGVHDLAPPAHLEIDLPVALSARVRDHAIEDVTGIITRTFPTMPIKESRRAAHALVSSHVDNIPRLHRKFASYMMDLGREFG